MAARTVPVSLHPVFQQLFDHLLIHEVHRVEGILGSCCYDRCQHEAEVSEVETGIGYCPSHFREVSRG
jgi:hypothetical protein